MTAFIGRREFITLLGGAAAAWPVAAHGQQPVMPVVGLLFGASSAGLEPYLPAFLKGLKEYSYIPGQNVRMEYRLAGGQYERLPALAAELVSGNVDVIAAFALPAALAAKMATSTTPLVFAMGADPVRFGLVARLNRPGGNVTGATFLINVLSVKQLEVLHEIIPHTSAVAFLMNPDEPDIVVQTENVQAAAGGLGQILHVLKARAPNEIEMAFASLVQQRASALVVGADAFFNSERSRIIGLAARHQIPVVYSAREFAVAGGLASYGASISEGFRQAGIYVGRILKGEKPADLPVVQPTKFELVINLKTAKALGLDVPPSLLARADEVIE